MALQINIDIPCGISLSQAYAVVQGVGGSKAKCSIELRYYVSSAARDQGKMPAHTEYFEFQPSVTEFAPNFIKQAYQYLKTLPAFANAIDC